MEFLVAEIESHGVLKKEGDLSVDAIMGSPSELVVFQSPIHVKAKVQMTFSGIIAQASVETVGKLNCARCLKDFEKIFQGDFTETFGSENERINLAGNIREVILLEIPIQSLCKEECQGLCDKCGVDKNKTICKCVSGNENSLKVYLKNFPIK